MSVTFAQPVRVGPNSFRFRWSSDADAPVYRVHKAGVFQFATETNHATFTFQQGETPAIEVLDGTEPIAAAAEAPVELMWARDEGAAKYRIEEFVGAAWVVRAVRDAGISGMEHYSTQPLADATSTQFRVTPISAGGIEGTPQAVTATINRHPDPPDVTFAYDNGTNTVTIAAAA